MAPRKPKMVFDGRTRIPQVDARAHTLFQPAATGSGLNGPMRLVALLLMLWDEETMKGRIEWDHDQIADRTGLSVAQVADALDKLRQIHLVVETAAGPKLTWEPFRTRTLPAWRDAHLMRPRRMSVSTNHADSPKEKSDVHDQVEVPGAIEARAADDGQAGGVGARNGSG